MFSTEFVLQVARDHQARLLRADRPRLEPARRPSARHRLGAWIVRLGQTVEGPAGAHQQRASQA